MTDLRGAFLDQARWAADTSPLYERLCRIVADDGDLLERARTVPLKRARATVFLAAIHCLVCRDGDHPLADYFASQRANPRSPDDGLADALRDFCQNNADALDELLATRRNQTNSVRRSAVLYPAFAHVDARTDGPLALVAVGPSAGLNLHWDRYQYRYERSNATGETGARTQRVGPADASVTIPSRLDAGDPPLPTDPPTVHSRVGIDLHPLDVTDHADVEWLRALTWPEHDQRRALLADAIDVARRDPPRLIAGDVLAELPAVIDEIPADVPVVVYSTLVLYQVPDEVRERLHDLLADRAGSRPLHWLTGSGGVDDPGDGVELRWHRRDGDRFRSDVIATFQPHGEWFEWSGDR